MGGGSWTSSVWSSYSKSIDSKPRSTVFKSKGMDPTLDPKHIAIRESRDSDDNPESTPIMIFTDVTGSMGMLADDIIRKQCGVLMQEILDRRPVKHPQVLFGAIGDVFCDDAPLQVSQFESDIRIATQLESIYLEGRGGGNDSESYTLPWYFAAKKVSTDAFDKRGKKGYLFTMGDELVPPTVRAEQIERTFGENPERDFTSEELLQMASERFHVFHLIIQQGSYATRDPNGVTTSWSKILGQNVIPVQDYTKMAEIIVSTIQMMEQSMSADDVSSTWSGDTSVVVYNAVKNIATTTAVATASGTGVTRL